MIRHPWTTTLTILTAAALTGCAGGPAADVPPTPAAEADTEGVLRFWPVSAGTTVHLAGGREIAGAPASTETITIHNEGPAQIDDREVYVQSVESTATAPDGAESRGQLTVYQHVEPEQTYTYAVQSGDREPNVLQLPVVDLRSPIEVGTSWLSRTLEGYPQIGLTSPVPMNYSAVIMGTAETREVGGESLTGCLKVVETGVSARDVAVECADGETRDAKIVVDRTRWWCPDVGVVEESTQEAAVISDDDDAPCRDATSRYEAQSITHDD